MGKFMCLNDNVGGDIISLVFHIPRGSFNQYYLFCFSLLTQSFIFFYKCQYFNGTFFLETHFTFINWSLKLTWYNMGVSPFHNTSWFFWYLRKTMNWFAIVFILCVLSTSALRASACPSVGWQSGTQLLSLWWDLLCQAQSFEQNQCFEER